MAIVNIPFTFSVGNTIIASQHNSNFSTIYNDYNGNITNVNLSSSAGITYSQMTLTNSIKQSDIISTFNSATGFGFIPSGGIIMWFGNIASIPSGWFLCNGSNSTPDLRNKFILSADADVGGVANSTYTGSATASGGSLHHTHTSGTFALGAGNGGVPSSGNSFFTTVSGVSGNENVVPIVYYVLAFIMKS